MRKRTFSQALFSSHTAAGFFILSLHTLLVRFKHRSVSGDSDHDVERDLFMCDKITVTHSGLYVVAVKHAGEHHIISLASHGAYQRRFIWIRDTVYSEG